MSAPLEVSVISLILLTTVYQATSLGSTQLGDYITDFSPLFYDSSEVHKRHVHAISKRSVFSHGVELPLVHNGRKLDLSLHAADDGVFHPHTTISTDGVDAKFDTSHLYNGYIKGDPGSSVTGSIIRGVFQGMISTGTNDVFYVDRKEYHPSHPMTKHEQIHSVIYKKEDVDVQKFNELRRKKRGSHFDGTCGRRFDKVLASMLKEENQGQQVSAPPSGERKKRATVPDNHVCNMFLASDPEMWKYFAGLFKNEEPSMITQEISALFRELIREVNGIYKTTEFKDRTGYQLRVDRLAINKTCSANEHWFCDRDLDVSNFLNLNTYTNHNAYCLAYVLTYRDFADGTLGLAWVAKPGSLSGGVCSRFNRYSENGSPRDKSLNTGIVTIKNYGERVPKLMSQLTLAHEIGHNFGSEHDPEGSACTPYTTDDNENGNYIMYYAAISGKRPNNIQFSKCSRDSIGDVLANSKSSQCFQKPTDGHCGNQIVDGKEQCDCGYDSDCKKSGDPTCCKCCVGQNDATSDQNACKLLSGAACDPSQGPCCSATCGYQGSSMECSPETECSATQYCSGNNVTCPAAQPKSDGTICSSKTKVCKSGECSESVCSLISGGQWTECSVASDTGVDAESLCKISCEDPSTKKCYSSSDANLPSDFTDMLNSVNSGQAIDVKPGYPCDKDQGFCDYFLTCRKINELGPLARLKGILLELTSVEALTEWMKKYWWVVLLSVLGLGGLTFVLVKLGAKFTPSSNPAARRLSRPLTPSRRHEQDGTDEPLQAPGPAVRDRDTYEMGRR